MDYLIVNPVPAIVLYSAGILVQVPDPAKFALHKLAISQLRPAHWTEKRRKDLAQAESLIEYLMQQNPGALLIASDEAKNRPDQLDTFMMSGAKQLKNPELTTALLADCFGR